MEFKMIMVDDKVDYVMKRETIHE